MNGYKPFIDRYYYYDNHSAELEFVEAVLTSQQCEIFGGEFHLCKDQKPFKKQTGVFWFTFLILNREPLSAFFATGHCFIAKK